MKLSTLRPIWPLACVALVAATPMRQFPDSGESLRHTPLGSQSQFIRRIDASFPAIMDSYGTTAAAMMVIDNGRTTYEREWGIAEGKKVTANTVFGAASISKLVTAWGVMSLVDRGQIKLDDPVATYLTEEQRKSLPFATGGMTVRQLLSHTSGLSGHSAEEYWPGDQLGVVLDDLTKKSPSGKALVTIANAPGTAWAYSGAGFGLLQLVVENVTSESFSRFMTQALFRPLGMRHSFFGNPELTRGKVVEHLDEAGTPIARLGYNNLAAAAFYTTLADFSKLVQADLRRGRNLLHAGDVDLMESAAPGSGGKYGLGYFVEKVNGTEKVVGHDGSDVGWNSMYRTVPSRRSAIVILTNNSLGIGTYYPVMCGWYRSLASDRTDYCTPLSQRVVRTLYSEGPKAAFALNSQLAEIYGSNYAYDRRYWNYIGYQMLGRHSYSKAIELFHFNADLFPKWANAYDSLGDGYRAAGDLQNAIASYRHALQIQLDLQSSRKALEELGAK